jgi:hypothetical protein
MSSVFNEEIAYKKINCTDVAELKNIRIYLCTVKCKRENEIRNL